MQEANVSDSVAKPAAALSKLHAENGCAFSDVCCLVTGGAHIQSQQVCNKVDGFVAQTAFFAAHYRNNRERYVQSCECTRSGKPDSSHASALFLQEPCLQSV